MVIALRPVEGSHSVESFGYDLASRTLAVKFRKGKLYHVKEVPPSTAEAFEKAPSKSAFYNAHIRSRFDYELVVADELATADGEGSEL